MIMDNLIRYYQRLLKEYRVLSEAERMSLKGKILSKKIQSLKIAINNVYLGIRTLTTRSLYGNYKSDLP